MLTTIKGYYDHGQIILKEEPHISTKTEVIVTFLQDEHTAHTAKRTLGLLKGKISIPDDFNAPLEDLKDYM